MEYDIECKVNTYSKFWCKIGTDILHRTEAQLAHAVKDANGTSYNRAVFIKQRRAIMQRWADYLDDIKTKALKPSKAKK